MIGAHNFQRADEKLSRIAQDHPSHPVLVMTEQAMVEREPLDRYVKFHLSTFRQMLIANAIEAEPRVDAIFTVMMRQMFLAGVLAARDEMEAGR